jgi:hypothetical protein
MDRLKARWMRRLESWAVAAEYRAEREGRADSSQEDDQLQGTGRIQATNGARLRTDFQELGRPRKLAKEFTDSAAALWHSAMLLAKGKVVSNRQLAEIAVKLDERGYVPPADYLEESHAQQLKTHNRRNSHSRIGPVKTWSGLVSLADKDLLRGMRRLLSRCARRAVTFRSDKRP